jgi:hypothetical protein
MRPRVPRIPYYPTHFLIQIIHHSSLVTKVRNNMEFFPGERWTEEECRASLVKEEVCPKFSGQGRPEIASVISGFFGLEEERNRVRRDKYRGSMQARILFGGINVCDAESSNKKEEDTLHVSSNWSIFLGP